MDLNLGMNELMGFGKTMSDIGSDMVTKERENREAVEVIERMNKFAVANLQVRTDLIDNLQGKDAAAGLPSYTDWYKSKAPEFTEGLSPKAAQVLMTHMATTARDTMLHAQKHAVTQQKQWDEDTYKASLDVGIMNAASVATNPGSSDKVIDDVIYDVHQKISGLFRGQNNVERNVDAARKISLSAINSMVQNNNAGEAIELFKRVQPYFGVHGVEISDRLQRAAKEQASSATVDFLKERATDPVTNAVDYDKAIRALLEGKVTWQGGPLDAGTQRTVFENLKSEQSWYHMRQEQSSIEQKKVDVDAVYKLYKSDPRQALAVLDKSTTIPELDKRRIKHDLITPFPEGKSNRDVFLNMLDKVYDSTIPVEDKKMLLLKNGKYLNTADFESLGKIAFSSERSSSKEAVRAGIKTLTTTLITPGMSSQTQKERLDTAIKLYQTDIEAKKEELNSPEKIRDYANSILAMPQFTNVNPMDDMKTDMKRLRGSGLSGGNMGATPAPKTVMIEGKQYKDGDIITKDGKQSRVRVK